MMTPARAEQEAATQGPSPAPCADQVSKGRSEWTRKYGQKHQLVWIRDFPLGIKPPERVRIYRRCTHFIIQWWDPAAKANLSHRVAGDLIEAIARARQIEERLLHFKSSGQARCRRLGHAELVEAFLTDLKQRADAGEIDPATVSRYQSALGHYLEFCAQTAVMKTYAHAAGINREFQLQLSAFLSCRQISPNGRTGANPRPMKGQRFVLDTVRAMYEWAVDPERGHLVPEGFRNPFRGISKARPVFNGDPLSEPDITLTMAIDFIGACDPFQLRLFVPVLLFGLRAAEPCFLFREHFEGKWLAVKCNQDLNYLTKGRRDKRFPLLEDLRPFWDFLRQGREQGLLYERRVALEGKEQAALRGASLQELVTEFQRRCSECKSLDAAGKLHLRDLVLREAGGMSYDHLESEFRMIARRLLWPPEATLKDFRHLFATMLGDAGVPEAYRCYLMGHSPGRAAIGAYTHLDKLDRHYARAVRSEWGYLVKAILHRTGANEQTNRHELQAN